MAIEYLKCRANLHFEVDFRENRAICKNATKWDFVLFGIWIVFIHDIVIFLNTTCY